jgi:hypothetical protein
MPPALQFRRCETCKKGGIYEETPHTALPCVHCGKEAVIAPALPGDIIAERERCAHALDALAAKCQDAAGADGKVTAAGAATHMRNLATWMREAGK